MVAGIDISKDTLDVCVDGSKSLTLKNDRSDHSKLKKSLKGVRRVLMEATGTYHYEVAEYLHSQDFEVVIVNPSRAHFIARSQMRRNKTDAVDSRVLCEMARDDSHRLWSPPSSERKKLVGLLRAREDVVIHLGAKASQLKNPGITADERVFYTAEQAFLTQQKKEIEKMLFQLLETSEELSAQMKLLMSIPGIGVLVAASLLAHLPEDLVSARQAAAYAGLTPRIVQSGLFKGRTRLSKMGHSGLRKLLYLSSLSARRAPMLKEFYERIASKTGSKKSACLALAHKLIRIAFGVLKSGQSYNQTILTNK